MLILCRFQSEYLRRHPRGMNPVKLNDVFFSVHASIVACITAVQCLMYEVSVRHLHSDSVAFSSNRMILWYPYAAWPATDIICRPVDSRCLLCDRGWICCIRSAGQNSLARLSALLQLHQIVNHNDEICATGDFELSPQEHRRLEHRKYFARFHRWLVEHAANDHWWI